MVVGRLFSAQYFTNSTLVNFPPEILILNGLYCTYLNLKWSWHGKQHTELNSIYCIPWYIHRRKMMMLWSIQQFLKEAFFMHESYIPNLNCGVTLQMFCLLNPQMFVCEPNPKTTSSDFYSWKSVTKIFCFHAISTDICLLF